MKHYLVPFHRSNFTTPLLEEMDKFFNDFASTTNNTIKTSAKNQSPKVNAYRQDGKYCIDASVPLATKDDINIELEENMLRITVNAHQDKEVSDNDYIFREISRSQMTRVFMLGEDIIKESAKSTFKDGILHIEFDAKKEEEITKVKTLSIE